MNMRVSVLALFLIVGFVQSQPVQAPEYGGGIDRLTSVMANNTLAFERNTKLIEDTYGKIEQSFTNWTPKITFGVSVFLLIMYLTVLLFEKIRVKRNKKHYEERIKDLEDAQKLIIEQNNKIIEDINLRLTPLVSVLEQYENKSQEKPKINKLLYRWQGALMMFLFMFILKVLGVL